MEEKTIQEKLGFSIFLTQKLLQIGIIKKYQSGELLFSEEGYSSSIPIVLKGTLKITRTEPDGKEILLYYVSSGESCVMSFLGGVHCQKNKVKAEVEESATLLMLPIKEVEALMRKNPEWQRFIFSQYHNRIEELLQIVNQIAFKKIDERLWLLLQKKTKVLREKELNITHEQLANELGTARVVISRLLKELETKGKLKLSRNKITIIHDTIR